VTESYVTGSACEAGAAAELATSRKEEKYASQHWKQLPLCAHHGRNLGPNEHVSFPNSLPIWEEGSPQRQAMTGKELFCSRVLVLEQRYNAVLLHDNVPAPDCTD